MKKLLILFLVLPLFLIGCSEYTEIEQRVSVQSRIDCTYYVKSYLWVRKGFPSRLTENGNIEKGCFSQHIKASGIAAEKAKQLKELQPYKKAVDKCLKDESRRCKKP